MVNRFDDWEGEYLQHYGVLGMKWGVHRNAEKAFEKASSKKNTLDLSASKKHVRSAKVKSKLQKMETGKRKLEVERDRSGRSAESKAKLQSLIDKDNSKISKLQSKSVKAEASYAKANLKAAKWTNVMMKTFGTTSYSEFKEKNQRSIDKGKTKTEILLKPRNKS